MKKLSSHFVMLALSAITLTSAGATYAADNAGKPGEGAHMGWHKMSPEMMREHMAKRQAKLHDRLKLSAAQEADWKNWTSAITPTGMAKHWNPADRAAMEKMSTPERMERRLQMSRERDARMSSRLAATKTFYAALSPEQQRVFNAETMHGNHHRHHGPHKEDHPRANG